MISHPLFVPIISIFAGFIDAIAGGGGLITIPMWVLVLGPGAHVVATNKVGALAASSMALFVYQRKHSLSWRKGIWFLIAIGVGSFSGSLLTHYISKQYFSVFLFILCPVILFVIWKKEALFAQRPEIETSKTKFILTGFVVGVYDGFFGPGGGTFMLLALLWFTELPLMNALALSKLANALSAALSLSGFALQGLVDWKWGFVGGTSILIGSFFGARLTAKKSIKIVRPALTLIVILLMIKILLDYFNWL